MTVLPDVNRAVLIVRPRQPFLDWIDSVESTLPEEERTPITLDELVEGATAYLIPVIEDAEDLVNVLSDAWPEIFEGELASWYADDEDWPRQRTREMFDDWFDVALHDMVFDLGHDPLKRS